MGEAQAAAQGAGLRALRAPGTRREGRSRADAVEILRTVCAATSGGALGGGRLVSPRLLNLLGALRAAVSLRAERDVHILLRILVETLASPLKDTPPSWCGDRHF